MPSKNPGSLLDPISLWLLIFLIVVFGGWLIYYLARLFSIPRREGEKKGSSVGWIIDAYQEHILQLKQNEQEMGRLKQSAEEDAKQMEYYNENIVRSVPSGILTLDMDKKITMLNPAAGQVLNLSPHEVEGKPYKVVFGQDSKIDMLLDETIRSEQDGLRQECVLQRMDGKKIYLGMNISLLRGHNRQVIGAILMFTDLTDIKALQEQVELKQRLAVMGQMSAWIAHEFRNSMGTILGFASLISKTLAADHAGQKMVTSMTREISDMERLISELLSYGKKMAIHPVPTALDALIRDLTEPFMQQRPDVEWSFSFPEPSLDVPLDPVLMKQVFTNIVQNGLEAMPNGGKFSFEMVYSPNHLPDRVVEIIITDTGMGIPHEHLDKIFLTFFTTKDKGTGLGLALAHRIVLSHHGHITVESHEGAGTTFTISLPISKQQL